jgi:hypothetical protein
MDGRVDLDLEHRSGGEDGPQEEEKDKCFSAQYDFIIEIRRGQVNTLRPALILLDFLLSIN